MRRLAAERDLRALLPLLDHRDTHVREEATSALHELAEADPSLFLELLRSGSRELQRRSIEVLAARPGFDAARLIPALGDDTGRVYPAVAALVARYGEEAIPELIRTLASGREELRRGAVLALQQMDRVAWPTLRLSLVDPSHRVRLGAAQALEQSKWTPVDDREEFALRYALEDWDAIVRMRKAAVPPLLAALQDPHFGIREEATRTLGRIGDVAALPPLLKLVLHDPEEEVRAAAGEALGRLGEPRAIPSLRAALRDRSHTVRLAAASALETFGWLPETEEETIVLLLATEQWPLLVRLGEPAVPALVRALADDYYGIRTGAGEALLNLGPAGRQALEEAREHPNPTIRDGAIGLLVRAGPVAATSPALAPIVSPSAETFLVDEGPPEREAQPRYIPAAAVFVPPEPEAPISQPIMEPGSFLALIAKLATAEGTGALRSRISATPSMQREHTIRAFIEETLRRSEEAGRPSPSTDLLVTLAAALESPDPSIRLVAVEVFGRLGRDAVDPLLPALEDPDRLVRCAAVDALAGLMDSRATAPILLRLRADPEEEVREHAAWALGESGEVSVVPALIDALSDPYFRVRSGAAAALTLMGPGVLPALRPVLAGDDLPAALGAARTLGALRDEASIPGFLDLLAHDEPEAGTAAIAALAALGLAAASPITAFAADAARPPAVRVRAVRALAGLGLGAEDGLGALARDPDPEVAAAARDALDSLRPGGFGREPPTESVSSVREVALPVAEENEVTLESWHRESPAPAVVAAAPSMPLHALSGDPVLSEDELVVDPVAILCGALGDAPEDAPALLRRLGQLGDPRAFGAIAGRLFAGAPPERRAAAEALRSMPPERTTGALAGALHDPDPGVREAAIASLGASRARAAMPLLVDRLADPDYSVREAALGALDDAGAVAFGALIEGLGRPERELRTGAAQVLRNAGWSGPGETAALRFALASEDWRTLARFGEAALEPLAAFLTHPDPDLRLGAVIALGGIGGDRAIDLIRQAYADPSPLVRNRAALLLHERKIDDTRA